MIDATATTITTTTTAITTNIIASAFHFSAVIAVVAIVIKGLI